MKAAKVYPSLRPSFSHDNQGVDAPHLQAGDETPPPPLMLFIYIVIAGVSALVIVGCVLAVLSHS